MANYEEALDEREQRLINNCLQYADGDPAGLPGHDLMIVIAKLAREIGYHRHLARKGTEYLQMEEYTTGIWELVNKNLKLFGDPPAGANVMALALEKLQGVVAAEAIRPSVGDDVEAFLAEDDLEQIKEYVRVTEKVLANYQSVLEAIPACEAHGDLCVSHAFDWIKARLSMSQNEEMPAKAS